VSAHAQSEILGPEAFDGQIDLRASVVGGETGWLEGGFGKLREGGSDDGETKLRAAVAAVDLAWKPRLSWSLSGLISVTHQDGQSRDVDLNEAYLKYASGPGETRLTARAGAFWPPISLEHGGSTWGVIDTITPSAANSWVGEELKVLGLEAAACSCTTTRPAPCCRIAAGRCTTSRRPPAPRCRCRRLRR
jgi:hypothetical protein